MINTVITISLKTTKEQFESKEFQEVLNGIKSGEMKREFEKSIEGMKAACSYWTDNKIKK